MDLYQNKNLRSIQHAIYLAIQKQLFPDVLQNRGSQKSCKFHRKTFVLESHSNKVVGREREPDIGVFLLILGNSQERLFFKEHFRSQLKNVRILR